MKRSRNNHRELWRSKGFGSFLFNLKRNRLWIRRLAFLWIVIVALELFCPILDCPDENDFSGEKSAQVLVSQKSESSDKLELVSIYNQSGCQDSSFKSVFSSDNTESISKEKVVHCADECPCHATAIPSLAFKLPDHYVKPAFSSITYTDALTLALPPPFEPPKSA